MVLHRRSGDCYAARIVEVDEDELDEVGAQIRRAFESRERLAQLRARDDLLDARLEVAMPLLPR